MMGIFIPIQTYTIDAFPTFAACKCSQETGAARIVLLDDSRENPTDTMNSRRRSTDSITLLLWRFLTSCRSLHVCRVRLRMGK